MKLLSRFATATAATALAAGALLVPATAQAAPILAEDTAVSASSVCTVTGGDLSWGVKERFRSYVSGSIAHGSWDVSDGATYETPLFGWANPTGEIDAETGEGIISFTGTIHFTGHDSVLDMYLSNPSIELKGDGTARLLLDAKSNDREGNLKLDETQVSFAKIDAVGALDPASGEFSFVDAPGVLTADGAQAFGDFYASGEEIDPMTFNVQFSDCEGAGGTAGAAGGEDQGAADGESAAQEPVTTTATSEVPWLPIAIGGVAVVIIAVTATMLIAGRKKNPAAPASDADQAPEA